MTQETILYYLSAREGDYFNEDLLKKDFRVLWSTGFFSDVRIERDEGTKGKIVRIIVEENPVIKTVTYKTGKKVKEDDIVNKLKEKDEYILPYSYYSPAKVQKIKKTIGDLLAEKGLQAAKIDAEVARKGKNEVDLTFRIDEGPKVRVGEIVFEGRSKLPESVLREAMKDNKTHGLLSWIAGKDVFKQNKIPDDVDLIKKKFQENGYMEAIVGEPRTEAIEKRTIFFRKQKMMRLVIPVNAGYLYRVGEIKIEGNKAVNGKYLRSLVKLEKGEVYSTKVREKAIEKMGETYRDGGYLYAQVAPVESLDPKHKVVNLTFNVYEGDIAFLHRLEFRGNNYTKDKVIRREMMHPGRRPVQPGLLQGQHPPDQAARARRPREGPRHQAQSRGPDPDRRPGQRQGAPAEQHPVHGRLQRLRGDLRGLQLFDRQLPRGGGNPGIHGPDREAGQELFVRVHRALSSGPADHRRLQHLRPQDRLPLSLQPEEPGDRPDPGRPARRLLAGQRHLQLSEHRRHRAHGQRLLRLLCVPCSASGSTTSARSSRSSTGRRSTAR